jgi:hypothetical protein
MQTTELGKLEQDFFFLLNQFLTYFRKPIQLFKTKDQLFSCLCLIF